MTISAETLLTIAADRLRATRPELAVGLDLSTPDALGSAKAAIKGAADDRGTDILVVAVVGRFSLPDWVRETCRFALSLSADRAREWRHAFTRTVYLAGRPDNLRERFAFDHLADDGSFAWAGPAPEAASTALRRLLKTFSGARPLPAWAPVTVDVPAPVSLGARPSGRRPPVHRDLYIATARVTVSDALVQVNHLLAEAALDGLVAPGDRLTLRAVPRLTGLAAPFAALRVDADPHRPHELRAYAGLTEEN
ncbi:DUF6182 family protein [Streptomyces abikoensis]|uniref:DUF6182 family protein n=1 Tax=Streptomyces abikoensis TaxID=97398 RepID=A0ABW7SZG6_9ACTN